jgi:ubiquinone/menaquinone biosynthesis C-methylase UbiE
MTKPNNILEIACGMNPFFLSGTRRLSNVDTYIGLDRVSQLPDNMDYYTRAHGGRCRFMAGDATNTGLAGESFDEIIAANLFCDPRTDNSLISAVGREVYRLLRSGDSTFRVVEAYTPRVAPFETTSRLLAAVGLTGQLAPHDEVKQYSYFNCADAYTAIFHKSS